MQATAEQLAAAIDHVKQSPRDAGVVELIVVRPAKNERRVLDEATLDSKDGLLGDLWPTRPSRLTPGAPNPDQQLTLMNARAIAAIAGSRDAWPPAGDQLYVDFDLSAEHLPAGTRLALGDAIIEITAVPHTGCASFTARFGSEAMKWVNSPEGRALNLRGIYARVIRRGVCKRGDTIRRL